MLLLLGKVQLHQANEGSKSVKLNGIESSLIDYSIFYLLASQDFAISPNTFAIVPIVSEPRITSKL